jgi:NADH-quinone oxidoreductase subunit E
MTLLAKTRTEIEQARDRYPRPRSAILPALWAVQHELGEITPAAMGEVAGILNVAPSEVEAVSTFYSMYFQHPHGRHEVIVCINVSCALRGAEEIVEHLESSLGCASGETTADGEFTWSSTVECLGGCGGAPTMQVDHHFQENLTPQRVDQILGALREAPTPHQAQTGEAGGVAGGSAGAQKARRRGVPAMTGPAPTEPSSAVSQAAITDATLPAAGAEPTVGPSEAPPIVASADQVRSTKRSARKSAPLGPDVAGGSVPDVPSAGVPDASSPEALPLTTPKEPDPAATTAPQPKARGRRPSKGAQ